SLTLKGIPGQIPILFGVLVGYVVSVIVTLATPWELISFGAISSASFFAVPSFTLPKFDLVALIAVTPIAIATIPESSAHLFQLDLYVDELAKEKGRGSFGIKQKLGLNLIGDGIADIAASLFGGPGGTSYGESLATQSMTRNFSVFTIVGAAILAIAVSFFGGVSAAINSIPMGVVGGVSVYAFGFIAVQGLKLLFENKVNLANTKNVIILAVVFIIGLSGNIPVFGIDFPAIASAAVLGIVLNLVLPNRLGEKA
ncbi:MAG: xanthine permease, partial [Oscillospiraceae bacterium]|nr:xanthine permease [Oscillospiraceae bacterium]